MCVYLKNEYGGPYVWIWVPRLLNPPLHQVHHCACWSELHFREQFNVKEDFKELFQTESSKVVCLFLAA